MEDCRRGMGEVIGRLATFLPHPDGWFLPAEACHGQRREISASMP